MNNVHGKLDSLERLQLNLLNILRAFRNNLPFRLRLVKYNISGSSLTEIYNNLFSDMPELNYGMLLSKMNQVEQNLILKKLSKIEAYTEEILDIVVKLQIVSAIKSGNDGSRTDRSKSSIGKNKRNRADSNCSSSDGDYMNRKPKRKRNDSQSSNSSGGSGKKKKNKSKSK